MNQYAIRNTWWKYTEKIRDSLYCCFFFFMPFTQALTFKIGFPLKFSELALVILGGMFILFNKQVKLPKSIALFVSLLFFLITCSVVINLFWTYDYPLKEYATRFGYYGDSIARYVYFILALLTFLVSVEIFLTNTVRYIKVWIYGALTAAFYTWYLSISSALHLPYFLLPGMENPPQMISGSIIRCGTFPEGNSMGLFFLMSGAFALYIRKHLSATFLFISIIPTFSTLSIVSLFIFLVIYLKNFIAKKPSLLLALALLLIPVIYFGSQTKAYKIYIHDKLFTKGMRITNEGSYSKVDRLVSLKNAFQMGIDNPVFGVGLSNYSRHYEKYLYQQNLDAQTLPTFIRAGEKTIPNNIYGEIWAESGVLVFVVFLLLLIQLFFYAAYDKRRILTGMLVCLLFCFNAYPSFIMIYLWACMALPVAHYINHKTQTAE